MVHIAYDKESLKILAFLINNSDNIKPEEVFSGFENYNYKTTDIEPPFGNYKKHKVVLNEDEIVGYANLQDNKS